MPENAYTATRNAVTEALTEAREIGIFTTTSGIVPEESINDMVGMIMNRLAGIGVGGAQAFTLDFATPVLMVDVRDVIAAAARGAMSDYVVYDGTDADGYEIVSESPVSVVTTEFPAPAGRVRAYRQAMWPLATVFGVRVRTIQNDDDTYTLRIGGLETDIRAFRSAVLDTFLNANVDNLALTGLTEEEEGEFWATLAALTLDTDEHRALIDAAYDRGEAANAALNARFGYSRVITRIQPAEAGTPAYALAADALTATPAL